MTNKTKTPPPGSFAKLMASRTKEPGDTGSQPEEPASQLAGKPASEPVSQPVVSEEIGPVVERGRMFYITEKVDRWIDQVVASLKERGIHKADRSIVVNAILHNPKLYEPSSISELEEKVLDHLSNRYRTKTERPAS